MCQCIKNARMYQKRSFCFVILVAQLKFCLDSEAIQSLHYFES